MIVGEDGCYRLEGKGGGLIHIMTHAPGNGVQGNGHCETEPPTPRSLAAPADVMPCVCASYFAY